MVNAAADDCRYTAGSRAERNHHHSTVLKPAGQPPVRRKGHRHHADINLNAGSGRVQVHDRVHADHTALRTLGGAVKTPKADGEDIRVGIMPTYGCYVERRPGCHVSHARTIEPRPRRPGIGHVNVPEWKQRPVHRLAVVNRVIVREKVGVRFHVLILPEHRAKPAHDAIQLRLPWCLNGRH